MIEKSAKGIKGFLLYNAFRQEYFFRIYDPEVKGKFTDYEIDAEDIDVTIDSSAISLYESESGNHLSWSSQTLGRTPSYKNGVVSGLKRYLHKKESIDKMGVAFCVNGKTYPNWSYSGFNSFRKQIAYYAGIPLLKMEGYSELPYVFSFQGREAFDKYQAQLAEEKKNRIKWETVNDPLVPFFTHSDCDGNFSPEECAKIAPRLREILETKMKEDVDNLIANPYDLESGLQLVSAMEESVKTGQPLELH